MGSGVIGQEFMLIVYVGSGSVSAGLSRRTGRRPARCAGAPSVECLNPDRAEEENAKLSPSRPNFVRSSTAAADGTIDGSLPSVTSRSGVEGRVRANAA